MKSENYGVLPEIMGFFPNEIGLWGFFGIFPNENQLKNLKIARTRPI